MRTGRRRRPRPRGLLPDTRMITISTIIITSIIIIIIIMSSSSSSSSTTTTTVGMSVTSY